MAKVKGGCLCGAVRYECRAEAATSALCYCTDCQRFTGGAFSAGFMVAKKSFKLMKGQLKGFEITADSGNKVTRNFCPTCGSPVMNGFSAWPSMLEVAAGSLDDPSHFKPTMSIYVSSAPPWATISADIRKYPKMPGRSP
jgi:hypothetical protein